MDLERLKVLLRNIERKHIKFTSHAKTQIILRDGSKKEIIEHLLNPIKLIDFEKQSRDKYLLIFNISNSKTMILPIVFERKGLKVITYIMRHRSWKKTIEKRYGKKWKK